MQICTQNCIAVMNIGAGNAPRPATPWPWPSRVRFQRERQVEKKYQVRMRSRLRAATRQTTWVDEGAGLAGRTSREDEDEDEGGASFGAEEVAVEVALFNRDDA